MNARPCTLSAHCSLRQRWLQALSCVLPSLLISGCTFEPQLPDVSSTESDAGDRQDTDEQSGENYEQVSSLFDTLTTTVKQVRAFECACEVAGTTQTVAQCVDATLAVTPPPIVQCSKELLAADERSITSLSCEAQTLVDYLTCLETGSCSDFDHILACQIDHDTYKRANCTSLPWEIWASVQTECYGITLPPPFTCEDGEIINSEWVCDLAEDCEDGSDETDCHP